jgi:hypothetical protein
MGELKRETAYRAALDTAHADLNQVLDRMTQLHARQEQVGRVLDALRPVVECGQAENPVNQQPAREIANPSVNSSQQPVVMRRANDGAPNALQSQIDQALGMLATA